MKRKSKIKESVFMNRWGNLWLVSRDELYTEAHTKKGRCSVVVIISSKSHEIATRFAEHYELVPLGDL
jgi:hypothetical protein